MVVFCLTQFAVACQRSVADAREGKWECLARVLVNGWQRVVFKFFITLTSAATEQRFKSALDTALSLETTAGSSVETAAATATYISKVLACFAEPNQREVLAKITEFGEANADIQLDRGILDYRAGKQHPAPRSPLASISWSKVSRARCCF